MKKIQIIIIMLFLLFLINGCKKEDDKEPIISKIESVHEFFHDDVSSIVRIIGNPVLKKPNDNFYNIKYSLTAYMQIKQGTSRQLDYYQFDWTFNDNTYDTYYHYTKNDENQTIVRSFAQNFHPSSFIDKESIIKVAGKIKYSLILNNKLHNREYTFLEEMLTLSNDDFNNYNNINDNNEISVNCTFNNFDYEDFYRFKININIEKNEEPYHVDMQSWFVTNNNQIIPFIGVYNYTNLDENFESVTDERIYKYVDIKDIYIKALKTNNLGHKSELLYKLSFDDILNN